MKILIVTNLFPNAEEPTRGMYNLQLVKSLVSLAQLRVVAPVPWYPLRGLTTAGQRERNIAASENIDGLDVYHPRYLMIPGIGRFLYGFFFYVSLLPLIFRINRSFRFDCIFAMWVYPDGFGSVLFGKTLGKPVFVKALGSDINVYASSISRRFLMRYALTRARKVFCVSVALKNRLTAIGVPESSLKVVMNGVDRNLFKPLDLHESRSKLGLPCREKIILFVGNLVTIKGVEYLFEAVAKMKERCVLLVVGDGPLKPSLDALAGRLGLGGWIIFTGRKPHSELPLWFNACDVFCLPSLNEGCPNVVLEALACGRPVVATSVGGIPEIISDGPETKLVPPADPKSLADALQLMLCSSAGAVSSGFTRSWDDMASEIYRELCHLLKA